MNVFVVNFLIPPNRHEIRPQRPNNLLYDLPTVPSPLRRYDTSLSVQLLGGSDPCRRHVQADLAALGQQNVHGLLRILGKLALHAEDFGGGLRLKFRRRRIAGT